MNLFVMMECKKKIAVLGHFAECCTRQRTPLPSAMTMALGKDLKKKFKLCRVPARGHSAKKFKKNANFAECQPEGTRQRIFLKKNSNFAERRPGGTRQRNFF